MIPTIVDENNEVKEFFTTTGSDELLLWTNSRSQWMGGGERITRRGSDDG